MLHISKILLLIGALEALSSVLASEPLYPEVEDINKCDKKFERICAKSNYGHSLWYGNECLLKYRNFWERTVNTKWDLRFMVLAENDSCVETEKNCTNLTMEACKNTFGYEENFKTCMSNGKEYKEFTRYCDRATFCENGWATVKREDCSFKFEE